MSGHSIYLPETDSPSPWGLDILGAGYAKIVPQDEYPPRQHPVDHYFHWDRGRALSEFQLLFVAEGRGVFETEATGLFEFAAPMLFILFPQVWHRYRPNNDVGWKEYWVAFRGDFADRLIEEGELNANSPAFEVGHHEHFLTQMQLIQSETKTESFGFRRICTTATMQMLALATTLPVRRMEEKEAMRAVIRRACFIMRERVDSPLSAEALAEEMKVGYTYFRRQFKKYTGMSPKRYHSQLRLARIKTLLRETNLSVAEIADALGFDSPFHLSAWFKKSIGQAPSIWRQSAVNEPQVAAN